MTQGIKTSEFWTHLAILAATFSSSIGTVFDKQFVADHPAFASVIVVASLLAAAISQFGYMIGRSLVKSSDVSVPVVTDIVSSASVPESIIG